MKKLNKIELDVAKVASSLFLKGSTEWRIADYAFKKHLSKKQLDHLLKQLEVIPEPVKFRIYNHYNDILHHNLHDEARENGEKLHDWLIWLENFEKNIYGKK